MSEYNNIKTSISFIRECIKHFKPICSKWKVKILHYICWITSCSGVGALCHYMLMGGDCHGFCCGEAIFTLCSPRAHTRNTKLAFCWTTVSTVHHPPIVPACYHTSYVFGAELLCMATVNPSHIANALILLMDYTG